VWVVQEFILARDLQFQLADGTVPTAFFEDTFNALRDLDKINSFRTYNDFDTRGFLGPVSLRNCQLLSYRQRRISRGSEHSHLSLVSCVIDLAQGRECKDARDRLYAMLAVADRNWNIEPDYTVPLSVVLNNFATQFLLDGDLFILHTSGIRFNHDPSLSSFVPSVADWEGMTARLSAPQLGLCAANTFPTSVISNTGNTVSLKGVRVDTINRYQNRIPFNMDNNLGVAGFNMDRRFLDWFYAGRKAQTQTLRHCTNSN
jgi:hypothetical protein